MSFSVAVLFDISGNADFRSHIYILPLLQMQNTDHKYDQSLQPASIQQFKKKKCICEVTAWLGLSEDMFSLSYTKWHKQTCIRDVAMDVQSSEAVVISCAS